MGQVASQVAVARPETVVLTMAAVVNRRDRLSFLDLPGECRNAIYSFAFFNPKMIVTRHDDDPGWSTTYDEENPEFYATHVVRCNRSLLLTCKTIRAEATPLLSVACLLAVYKHTERTSPISRVPTTYLQGISRLEVEVHTFIWVPRKLLPSLKEVNLTHEDVDEEESFLHTLGCTVCGTEAEILREMVAGIEDWEWKRKQFARTATEEGFTIELMVTAFNDLVSFTCLVVPLLMYTNSCAALHSRPRTIQDQEDHNGRA